MSGFTEGALVKKLAELNSSQQSIQTLSFWLIHHRKHHANVVRVWFRELLKIKDNRLLVFMYLANDVIQNGKKKGPEYGREFGEVLKRCFEHMSVVGMDAKTKSSLNRILNIWEERGVYDAKQIADFKEVITSAVEVPEMKKRKLSDAGNAEPGKWPKNGSQPPKPEKHERTKTDIFADLDDSHVDHSPITPLGDPPDSDELVKLLQELENSASSDAVVREKIASLPREVSEVSLLSKLENKESGQRLSEKVNSAVQLLVDYNLRLANELEKRRRATSALRDYTIVQKELMKQTEKKLEEYNELLQKVNALRNDIKVHLESLPDVKQLPDVTRGLAPLPSIGDLFNLPSNSN